MRTLALLQCGLGSIPRLVVICGLSLLVLYSSQRGFSPGIPVFPSHQKSTLDLIRCDSVWFVSSLIIYKKKKTKHSDWSMIKETHRWRIKSFVFKSSARPGWRNWWRNFSLIAWYTLDLPQVDCEMRDETRKARDEVPSRATKSQNASDEVASRLVPPAEYWI